MFDSLKSKVQNLFRDMGYQIRKIDSVDPSMEKEFVEIYRACKGIHLQSIERLYALYQAMLYVHDNQIPGDIVECGVYKGGSIILAARVLTARKVFHKNFFLYDTFDGWPVPAVIDSPFNQGSEPVKLVKELWGDNYAPSLTEVEKNLYATGYPKEKFVFVKGLVENTIPKTLPEKISLLRLDTDGYESTHHELVHLYPRLSPNGILIVDDYGHWKGAKKAVDDYFREKKINLLLHRIDYTGRIAIKTQP